MTCVVVSALTSAVFNAASCELSSTPNWMEFKDTTLLVLSAATCAVVSDVTWSLVSAAMLLVVSATT